MNARIAGTLLLLLVACGDDGSSTPDPDGGLPPTDAGREPDAEETPDLAVVEPPDCASLVLDETFEIAPGLSQTSIHPSALFDGEGVWMTVTTVEEGTSVFDIYLVRVGCDGRQATPIRVSDTPMLSDLDADLALGPEGLLVAWQADGGTGTIETWVRLHDPVTGEPLGEPSVITTTREGVPLDGTVWTPRLLPASDGFDLVGGRGVEAASAFQAYVQPLDAFGAPVGDTTEPAFEPMVSQTGVSAVRTADGLVTAWTREPLDAGPSVAYRLPGAADWALVPTGSIEASAPALAVVEGAPWLVMSAGGGASRQLELVELGPDASTPLPSPGTIDIGPALAAGEGSTLALAWLRVISGYRNELFLRRVTTAPAVEAAPPIAIPTTGDAYPYAVELEHLGDDVFFLTWVEGESTRALRVAGRFIQL